MTLVTFTSEEGGGRSLLSCDLHCLGHFLINAADKVVVHHLMRMQQATSGQKASLLPTDFHSFQILAPT